MHQAVASAIEKLEGTWGLAILDKQTPDSIIVAKNGSPLLIGVGEGTVTLKVKNGNFLVIF